MQAPWRAASRLTHLSPPLHLLPPPIPPHTHVQKIAPFSNAVWARCAPPPLHPRRAFVSAPRKPVLSFVQPPLSASWRTNGPLGPGRSTHGMGLTTRLIASSLTMDDILPSVDTHALNTGLPRAPWLRPQHAPPGAHHPGLGCHRRLGRRGRHLFLVRQVKRVCVKDRR